MNKEHKNKHHHQAEKTTSSAFKNYVTPKGLSLLQDEYRELRYNERPKIVEVVSWAAKNGDRSENGDYIYGKRRLREIDRRLRYLTKQLETAVVVDPKQQQSLTQVFFGATVTYQKSNRFSITIKLVGIDEADLTNDKISWNSPIAKALMKSSVGDIIEFNTPNGREKIEVIEIHYSIEN